MIDMPVYINALKEWHEYCLSFGIVNSNMQYFSEDKPAAGYPACRFLPPMLQAKWRRICIVLCVFYHMCRSTQGITIFVALWAMWVAQGGYQSPWFVISETDGNNTIHKRYWIIKDKNNPNNMTAPGTGRAHYIRSSIISCAYITPQTKWSTSVLAWLSAFLR